MKDTNLTVKIFSPPFFGQTIALPQQGSISMGSSQNDDIYIPLKDNNSQSVRLELAIDGDSVMFSSAYECNVDDVFTVFNKGDLLPQNCILSISDVIFAIGFESSLLTLKNNSGSIRTPRGKNKTYILISISFFIVTLLFFMYILHSNKNHVKIEVNREELYAILKKENLDNVHVVWGENDTYIVLNGRANTLSNVSAVIKYLRESNIEYKNNIIFNDDLTSEIYAVLYGYGINDVKVLPSKDMGSFIFLGGIPFSSDWSGVEKELLKIRGLNNWAFHNILQQKFKKISSALESISLLSKVSILLTNNVVFLNAVLSEEEQISMSQLINKLKVDGLKIKVIYQNISYVSQWIPVNASVKISGGDGHYFLTLNNKENLVVGQLVDNKFKIDKISPKLGVDLSDGQTYVHVPISSLIGE